MDKIGLSDRMHLILTQIVHGVGTFISQTKQITMSFIEEERMLVMPRAHPLVLIRFVGILKED
jgi:hypothetical protein